LTRARLVGVVMRDAVIDRLVANLVVNGVEVPEGSGHVRVGGEWSAVETLRHLVFVHDSWFRRCCLGSAEAFSPIGLAPDYVPHQAEQGVDRAASLSLHDLLAVRDAQGAELERWLSAMSAGELSAPAPVPAGQGWPPYARGKPVLECLHVVLNEEWAHHSFCVRDIDLLGR
jgi:hypothetical protein